jgi:ribosomal protein L37AE/L43A
MRSAAAASLVSVVLAALPGCRPEAPAADPQSSAARSEASAATPAAPEASTAAETGPFTCIHHPEVLVPVQQPCPECGMKLIPAQGRGAYVCLQHLESVDIAAGECPRCGSALVLAETTKLWNCRRHSEVDLDDGGDCPLCGEVLRPALAAVVWICAKELEKGLRGPNGADDPGLEKLQLKGQGLGFASEHVSLESGRCRVCKGRLLKVLASLPHGDHNPKHGGVFFMASDRWHHVEGTLPRPGEFRLYLYDNFTRPLSAVGFEGKLFRSRLDAGGALVEDPAPIALQASLTGEYLKAEVPDAKPPFYCVVALPLRGKEERFDFGFQALSEEGSLSAPAPRAAGAAPAGTAALPAPSTPSGFVTEILVRDLRVRLLIQEHAWRQLYVPAFEAKELALALEDKFRGETLKESEGQGASAATPERAQEVSASVREVVRGAWLLDFHGDQGDRAGVLEAYKVFRRGVQRLGRLHPMAPDPSGGESEAVGGR